MPHVPAPAPADLIFGLGDRAGADVVRVLWPSGILQAETGAQTSGGAATAIKGDASRSKSSIASPRRAPTSTPGTASDSSSSPTSSAAARWGTGWRPARATRRTPTSTCASPATGSAPATDDTSCASPTSSRKRCSSIASQLVAVAHPADVEVHPNEGLVPEPRPFTLYSARAPAAAHSRRATTAAATCSIASAPSIGATSDGFALERVRGYAAEHTLTLTLPPPGPAGRRLLLLTGWTDYAFSGDNVAAHQAGLRLLPPSLEIKTADGTWRTVIEDIGMPVGRPQTVAVDLSDRRARRRRTRCGSERRCGSTGTRSWSTRPTDAAPVSVERLDPVAANLRWRGFSAEQCVRWPGALHLRLRTASRRTRRGSCCPAATRARATSGRCSSPPTTCSSSRGPATRSRSSFDATALPPLPDGWTRTFLLYADGFSKEMNLHSSSPDSCCHCPSTA